MAPVDDAAAVVAESSSSSSSSGGGGGGNGGGGGGSVVDGSIDCTQAAPISIEKEPRGRCTVEAAAANGSHDPAAVGNDAGFQFAGDVNAGGDHQHPSATGGVLRDSNRWNISSSESDDDGGVDDDDDNVVGGGGGGGNVRRRSSATFPHIAALTLSSPPQLPATPSASAPAIELTNSTFAEVESTLQPSSSSTVPPSAMLPLLSSALLSQPQPTSSSFSQNPFIFTAAHPTSSIVSTPLPPPSHFLPHRLKKPGWKSESSRRRRGSDIGGDEQVGDQEVEQNHKNMIHRGFSVKPLPAPVFGKGEGGENDAEVDKAEEEVAVLTGVEGTGGNAVDVGAKVVSDGGGGSTSTAAADPKAMIQRLEVENISMDLKKRRDLVITGGVWRLIRDD